jgi:hypothetical protein
MNTRQQFRCLLEEEEKNTIARAELYYMMTFWGHPAPRLAMILKEIYQRLSTKTQVALLNCNYHKLKRFPEKVDKMMKGHRNLYKRTRGCATQVIDAVAGAACIAPAEIFAPGIPDVKQLVREHMLMLLNDSANLSSKEKDRLESKMRELDGDGIDITASWLETITVGTLLPPYYFSMNGIELNSYQAFREPVMELVNEIVKFYPYGRLCQEMQDYVEKKFHKLIKFVDNDPCSFINEFCLRFRQQVLDGNTLFSSYRLPLRSILKGQFRNFLIDKCRVADTWLQRRPVLETELLSEDSSWGLDSMASTCSPEADSGKGVFYGAILSIPSAEDRKRLFEFFYGVLQHEEDIDHKKAKKAKKAMIRWAPHMLDALGEKARELPREWQQKLFWCAYDAFAQKMRSIYTVSETVQKQGHSRCWLADQLGVSSDDLGKWTRGDGFPKPDRLQKIDRMLAGVREIVENV